MKAHRFLSGLVIAALYLLPAAFLPAQAETKPASAAAAAAPLHDEVAAVIHDMAGRWAKNAWMTIASDLWDQNEPMPMYLAEEQEGWLIGWDAVRGYFNPKQGPGFMQAANYEASNIQVRPIADNLAVATWNIYWQAKMRPSPAMAERLRATGIFRKTGSGWKFIHYAEAPKSPAMYIRDLYSATVSPEFRERIKSLEPTH